jgi:NAD(P)-dependent dehydrogenase (short-subunit alcohol dehydrogenase family)
MSGVEDRVIIVTGAGGGLGRQYAKLLAAEGAKVVVNDLGTARDGTGAIDVRDLDDAIGRLLASSADQLGGRSET